MQTSRRDVHEFLLYCSGARNGVQTGEFKHSEFRLEFETGRPAAVRLRDLRTTCCLIDLGTSIYTLDFDDVLACRLPAAGAGLPVLAVRSGCLARDVVAGATRNARTGRYVSPRPHMAHAARDDHRGYEAIPLNPPGGQPRPPVADDLEAGFAAAQRHTGERAAAPQRQASERVAAVESQRSSLEEIEAMVNQLWGAPDRSS